MEGVAARPLRRKGTPPPPHHEPIKNPSFSPSKTGGQAGRRATLPENLIPCLCFSVSSFFLLETQGRNIDILPWMKPSGSGGPKRTPFIFCFSPGLRASVVQRSCLWLRYAKVAGSIIRSEDRVASAIRVAWAPMGSVIFLPETCPHFTPYITGT